MKKIKKLRNGYATEWNDEAKFNMWVWFEVILMAIIFIGFIAMVIDILKVM